MCKGRRARAKRDADVARAIEEQAPGRSHASGARHEGRSDAQARRSETVKHVEVDRAEAHISLM